MAESIVKVPKNINADYDFIAFSFNGMHSYEDFGIYRTSDGDRYNVELGPQLHDRTAEITGADGMLFFGSNHKQKVFNINFAFECLTDEKIRQMKKWLDGKEIHDLWFAEEPYKVYSAKVTSIPSIKYVPFDDDTLGRVYKGEGTV
jgi:predicted phage tail component-like protein